MTNSKENSWRNKAIEFLGLKKSMVALMSMVILVGLGEKMAERFLPIYLLALGGGFLSVGFLNGMDNLFSALYSFPGGYLSDRLGHKKALLVFNLIALFGYAIVIIFPYWPAVFAGAVFFLSWTAISLPAIMGLVSKALPQNKRTMGVSMHSLVRRIPMALGPLIGGALIGIYGEKTGVRMAFVAAFVLGLVSLFVQQVMIDDDKPIQGSAEKNPFKLWRFMGADLKRLLVSDILIRYAEQIPYAFVVVWCLKNNTISAFQFGMLTAIEMVVAMLVYIPVAYLADKSTKKPFVLITFFNFTVFPLFLLFSHSFPMMVLAFVIRGLKEFGEPTRKALIMDLAPEDKKAGMFGLYYLVRDVIVSLAAFGGAFLWQISPAANLLTATGFGLLGTLYFWAFGRDLKSV
ncbi:MAG: MFS transporter [Candidatus Edwardsbacteria bacterium]|nr:MFS transporter [Candidatus Edwardsbacteria bacterium]MBU1577614.1 MFS transporter [Candidatus Edwardsbacteria bacterium]MBU2462953.1 MFS transporter [Candidatus Edwardsbacteria bacterium]MBU2595106.1 MFS transporter [Candidatus Edwardsbacteria bacterium]